MNLGPILFLLIFVLALKLLSRKTVHPNKTHGNYHPEYGRWMGAYGRYENEPL